MARAARGADRARRPANDRGAIAHAGRDLRYWTARRSTAQADAARRQGTEKVQFGSTVTIERDDGRRQTFRIVGEDEAEPNEGTLSYASPVARALMGKSVGRCRRWRAPARRRSSRSAERQHYSHLIFDSW